MAIGELVENEIGVEGATSVLDKGASVRTTRLGKSERSRHREDGNSKGRESHSKERLGNEREGRVLEEESEDEKSKDEGLPIIYARAREQCAQFYRLLVSFTLFTATRQG